MRKTDRIEQLDQALADLFDAVQTYHGTLHAYETLVDRLQAEGRLDRLPPAWKSGIVGDRFALVCRREADLWQVAERVKAVMEDASYE